jgi:hypothetical protein
MKFIQNYINYLRDNPRGLWFKRKLYGWGWVPVRWEGWASILVYVALLAFFATTVREDSSPYQVLLTFIAPVVLLTLGLIWLCYKKGEHPRWQWGKEEN